MENEWSMFLHDLERTGYSSPAVIKGKVYIVSFDEYFYCLDADTGEELWSYYIEGLAGCSPAVYDGKVYVGSDYDYFYFFDADTGDEIWKFYKGYKFPFTFPTVVGGRIYFTHFWGKKTGQHAFNFNYLPLPIPRLNLKIFTCGTSYHHRFNTTNSIPLYSTEPIEDSFIYYYKKFE